MEITYQKHECVYAFYLAPPPLRACMCMYRVVSFFALRFLVV